MTRSYADLPDEYFERYFETYRELCSRTPRVWLTLFLGLVAQKVALSFLFEALAGHPLMWLTTAITDPPFIIYLALVFLRVPPPVMPRTYRRLLLLVVSWFAVNAVISLLSAPIWAQTARGGWTGVVVVGACMIVGSTAVVTIVNYHNKFRDHELQQRP